MCTKFQLISLRYRRFLWVEIGMWNFALSLHVEKLVTVGPRTFSLRCVIFSLICFPIFCELWWIESVSKIECRFWNFISKWKIMTKFGENFRVCAWCCLLHKSQNCDWINRSDQTFIFSDFHRAVQKSLWIGPKSIAEMFRSRRWPLWKLLEFFFD